MRTFGSNDFILLLYGAQWTVLIAAVAFVGGMVGGLIVALCRTSTNRILANVTKAYIELFQGTPLLMQLFLVYFGFSIFGLGVSAWTAIAVAYSCHASAFLGDIWRGGIEAVPKGQSEAGSALGLSYFKSMRLIVLPQAWRISLSSTVGFLVQLIKGTSLASIVGFTELARSGQLIVNATYQPFIVYGIVALIYFSLCWPLSLYSTSLESRYSAEAR
jgi:polar amino acid transport system permease protein